MDLKKEVVDNQIVVVLIPNEQFSAKLMEIVDVMAKNFKKVCYISMNKPYDTIIKTLEKNNVDPKKFYFIDCITRTVRKPEAVDHCKFVTSPRALTELSITMTEVLKKQKVDSLIFDSLSTLLVYESLMAVTKFAHTIIAQIRVSNSHGVFTSLKEDVNPALVKDLNMFADRVLDLGKVE